MKLTKQDLVEMIKKELFTEVFNSLQYTGNANSSTDAFGYLMQISGDPADLEKAKQTLLSDMTNPELMQNEFSTPNTYLKGLASAQRVLAAFQDVINQS